MNFILIIIIMIPFCYGEDNVLLHVHTIFRHGDRAPTMVTSPDKIKYWPNGLSEITDVGIKQHFQLGQWLRRRYDGFLSKKFNYQEIYVRSTDVNRTLMSAESNLAGMYYNKVNMIIPGLIWRPIPVHTIPEKSDIVMLPEDCDKYNIKKEEMYNSARFYPLLQKYQSTLDLLRKVFKNPNLQFKDLWSIQDSLFCEKVHNIPWDKWVTNELYMNLTSLNDLDWQIMYYGEELRRLSGGLFLNEIIIQMKEISKKPLDGKNERLRIYSGHDTDLAALMSAIGVYNDIQPPYASCLIIELWKNTTSNLNNTENLFVKMYFKNTLNQNSTVLPELILKDCKSHPCSLKKFIEVVKPRTMDLSQYNKECFTTRYKMAIWDVSIFSAVIVVLLIIYIIYLKVKTRSKVVV